MNDTGFHVPADQLHRLPTSYMSDPATGALQIHDAPYAWAGGSFAGGA